MFCQKSPTFYKKSPTFYQKSPIFYQKSPFSIVWHIEIPKKKEYPRKELKSQDKIEIAKSQLASECTVRCKLTVEQHYYRAHFTNIHELTFARKKLTVSRKKSDLCAEQIWFWRRKLVAFVGNKIDFCAYLLAAQQQRLLQGSQARACAQARQNLSDRNTMQQTAIDCHRLQHCNRLQHTRKRVKNWARSKQFLQN